MDGRDRGKEWREEWGREEREGKRLGGKKARGEGKLMKEEREEQLGEGRRGRERGGWKRKKEEEEENEGETTVAVREREESSQWKIIIIQMIL